MCSSDVMLRINSSASSDLITGPSTRCKMPCTRMVGDTPTRICRSDAPSATTNCNKSDIEYDIKIPISCTRMVGDTPTQICRSDAPSATTNCNKSDIEYDIKIQMPCTRMVGDTP